MPDQVWRCPKCNATYETPLPSMGFFRPCKCGNKKEWTYVSGPPPPERREVRSTAKNKETK